MYYLRTVNVIGTRRIFAVRYRFPFSSIQWMKQQNTRNFFTFSQLIEQCSVSKILNFWRTKCKKITEYMFLKVANRMATMNGAWPPGSFITKSTSLKSSITCTTPCEPCWFAEICNKFSKKMFNEISKF